MNIFYLDHDIDTSVSYHIDKHVIKIPLECAQMLSTANRSCGLDEGYKSSYINHPMNKWVRTCLENWFWMKSYAISLNEEYKFRYNKKQNHKSIDVINSLSIPNLPRFGYMTDPPCCMPDHYKINNDVVQSYRNYYRQEKIKIASWKTPRSKPAWL